MKDLNRKERLRKGKQLKFSLDIPPSVNKLWIIKRDGKRALTAHARQYMSNIRAYSMLIVDESSWKITSRDEWVYMDLVFYFPDRIIRDSHNCIKVLMDGLEGVVFENDYALMPRIQAVELDEFNPRVVVTLSHQTKREREDVLYKFG